MMAHFVNFLGGQRTKIPSFLLGKFKSKSQIVRRIHVSSRWGTDGVYRDLTNMRVKIPWVEALRKQNESEPSSPIDTENSSSSSPSSLPNRHLTAKKMSDSFHSVVRRILCNVRGDLLTDIRDRSYH